MVRLRETASQIKPAGSNKFQFQYGAIKSKRRYQIRQGWKEFQFQYGAIKRIREPEIEDVFHRFNSNMVRLRGF